MTTVQLQAELQKLIANTTDVGFLEQIRNLFLRPTADKAAFVEMNRMADLSEEAIAKGEVYTREEVEAWLKEQRAQR